MPTDERFKKLSDIQKLLIYYMVAFAPTSDETRKHGLSILRKEQLEFGKEEKKILDSLGIDAKDIKKEIDKVSGEFI